MKELIISKTALFLKYIIWGVAHSIVYFGVSLIVFQFSTYFGHPFPFFSQFQLDGFSAAISTISLIFVCVSIYIEDDTTRSRPGDISKQITAPFFILVGAAFLVVCIRNEWQIDAHYVDGLSFIALGGSMMRLTGNPTLKCYGP